MPARPEIERLRALLGRDRGRRIDAEPGVSRAAVATVLRPRPAGDTEILLIRRTEDPRDPWSGHMAFPGGRADPTDPDLLSTARREAEEEVGLRLADDGVEVLGRLDDVQAMARGQRAPLIITPYVFLLDRDQPLVPNRREVEEAIWTELSPLWRGEASTTKRYELEGRTYELPGYRVGDRVVWGLTFHMLQLLFSVMRSEEP